MNQQTPARLAQPKRQAPKLPVFSVTKFTPVETGTLKAFVNLMIGRGPNAIEICKFRLIQQADQPLWLSPPQEIWTTDTGERRYTNLVVLPKEWRDAITETAVTAWEQYQSGEGEVPR